MRTSNESASDLQDLAITGGQKIYEKVGQLVADWGQSVIGASGYSNLGAVIGATYPRELKQLRQIMPHSYFLIPGLVFRAGVRKILPVVLMKTVRGL